MREDFADNIATSSATTGIQDGSSPCCMHGRVGWVTRRFWEEAI